MTQHTMSILTEETHNLESVQIPCGWVAVRRTIVKKQRVVNPNTEHITTSEQVDEHILTTSEFTKMKNGTFVREKQNRVLLTPALMTIFQNNGYHGLCEALWPENKNSAKRSSHEAAVSQKHTMAVEKRYSHLLLCDIDTLIPVIIEHDSHRVLSPLKQELAGAVWCSYLNGNFDESQYHLDKAAKILLQRDDVVLFQITDEDPFCEKNPAIATTPDEAIGNLPYHSSEPGREKQICFKWTPSQEDWDLVVKAKQKLSHPSPWEAMLEVDSLGLIAGGATKRS